MGLSAKNMTSETDLKDRSRPEPGKYHAVVVDTVTAEENDRNFQDKVTFQILNGTTAGQAGKQFTENYFRAKGDNEGDFQDQHIRLAMATKVLLPGAELPDFNVHMVKGRQCVIELVSVPAKDDPSKHYTNLGDKGFSVWAVENPDVSDVPKDASAIQQWGTWLQSQGIAFQMPTAAPAQAQAAQPSNGNGQQHAAAAGPPTSFGSV